MTMTTTPDFTESELWTLRQTLKERYAREINVDLGDAEIRLHPDDRTLAVRPVAVWRERGVSFAIMKVGHNKFRAQFYYRGFQQYGTGRDEYDDLLQCVVTLLQVQSDHERRETPNPVSPGQTVKNSDTESDIDYQYWGD